MVLADGPLEDGSPFPLAETGDLDDLDSRLF